MVAVDEYVNEVLVFVVRSIQRSRCEPEAQRRRVDQVDYGLVSLLIVTDWSVSSAGYRTRSATDLIVARSGVLVLRR